jgi:hypothetical protein
VSATSIPRDQPGLDLRTGLHYNRAGALLVWDWLAPQLVEVHEAA